MLVFFNLNGTGLKYLTSFRTTVKISRYLFRTLALILWALGALLSLLYFVSLLHQRKSVLRQEYYNSYEQAQDYIRHSADITRQLKYMAKNRLTGSYYVLIPLYSRNKLEALKPR